MTEKFRYNPDDPFQLDENGEPMTEWKRNFYEDNYTNNNPMFSGNTKLAAIGAGIVSAIIGGSFLLYSYSGQERLMNELVNETFPTICEKFQDSEAHNKKIIEIVNSQWFEKYESTLKAISDNSKKNKIAKMCYHTLNPRGNGYDPKWNASEDLRLMYSAGDAPNKYNFKIHQKIFADPSVKPYVKKRMSLERKLIEQNQITKQESDALFKLQLVSKSYNKGKRWRFYWENKY